MVPSSEAAVARVTEVVEHEYLLGLGLERVLVPLALLLVPVLAIG